MSAITITADEPDRKYIPITGSSAVLYIKCEVLRGAGLTNQVRRLAFDQSILFGRDRFHQ